MNTTRGASGRQIAMATLSALAVATVVLFVAVLPAEYGIDPLGSGRALGLIRPASPAIEAAAPPPDVYRVDAVELEIAPYDYVEYKYRLTEGATMVYSWEATAPLVQDFHGAPDGAEAGGEVSLERRTRTAASGALTAAFAGMHGWYWENPGATPVRVKLTSAGFYSTAIEYRSNRTRQVH